MKKFVQSLAQNKEFETKFQTDETFWKQVDEIVTTLKAPYEATINMQAVGYSMSDFYITWLRVQKNLERVTNQNPQFDLAPKLLEKMAERAPPLFENPLMVAAVYLDPRIMVKLDITQKAFAQTSLIEFHDRITQMINIERSKKNPNDTLDEIQGECMDQAEDFPTNSRIPLMQQFEAYERTKPYDIKAPLMEFWEKNKAVYPLLHQIAEIVHAVPSNQTGTERSLSSFSYIRSCHRTTMSSTTLSNILMVRLNKEIFRQQRQDHVNSILYSK